MTVLFPLLLLLLLLPRAVECFDCHWLQWTHRQEQCAPSLLGGCRHNETCPVHEPAAVQAADPDVTAAWPGTLQDG